MTTPTTPDLGQMLDDLTRLADDLDRHGHSYSALRIRTAIAPIRHYLRPSCRICNDRGFHEDGVCFCKAGDVYNDKLRAHHDEATKAILDASGFAS